MRQHDFIDNLFDAYPIEYSRDQDKNLCAVAEVYSPKGASYSLVLTVSPGPVTEDPKDAFRQIHRLARAWVHGRTIYAGRPRRKLRSHAVVTAPLLRGMQA